jgi:hypothetical protein
VAQAWNGLFVLWVMYQFVDVIEGHSSRAD